MITPETSPTWVERAVELTSRELERLIGAAVPGQEPPDEVPSGPARRRVVFVLESVDAETLFAALRTIHAEARAQGEEIDDGAALALLARQALANTTSIDSEPYRAVVHQCPTCDSAVCGEHEVSDTVAGEILCDAVRIDLSEGPHRGHLTRTIPPATRRFVLARDGDWCVVPGCSSRRWLHLHHLVPRAWRAWRVEHLDRRVAFSPQGVCSPEPSPGLAHASGTTRVHRRSDAAGIGAGFARVECPRAAPA